MICLAVGLQLPVRKSEVCPLEVWLKKAYLIGVDLGTSGTKAALYRTDGTARWTRPSQIAEIDSLLVGRGKHLG